MPPLSPKVPHRDIHSFPTRRSSDLDLPERPPPWAPKTPLAGFELSFKLLGSVVHPPCHVQRSEEHTSELQSRGHLVCRLLLEKRNLRILRTITVFFLSFIMSI